MQGSNDQSGPVLVLGGQRSGKSAFAEGLTLASGLAPVYVATARALDGEMRERIARHRASRGDGWRTVEAPLDLAGALRAEAAPDRAVLVDCLTLWLTNLLLDDRDPAAAGEELCALLPRLPGSIVLVSTEVGQGIVPANALARRFADAAGLLHQGVAAASARVAFVAAGLPLWLKG
ncbi:MAG: bifunctional adenosylcobinamide kinase/adenosylcobinamide-phosphate guanylyltransferase [Geminicoccaceae bacterium]|nr:bifunctional adenosylcobinamide kinase/adenosylcobinamide-phosphate guanylyltransferase [Geminicoccaceae bacterium]